VPTAAGFPLSVNASGTGTSPFVATFGSVTYTFSTGGPNFTTFKGATGGFTSFVAGATGGYTFQGRGGSNSVDFSSDPSPITANLHLTKPFGVSPNQVGPSQVAIAGSSCLSGCDTILNITTVTGSLNGGNTFVAGGPGAAETFKGGANNTVDFSLLAAKVTVNVTGATVGSLGTDQATAAFPAPNGTTQYFFSGFGAGNSTFVGAGGTQGTTFFPGSSTDTFIGHGLTTDTLNFANACTSLAPCSPGTNLQLCAANGSGPLGACGTGEAILGNIDEFFSGIKIFNGLAVPGAATTFVADDTTGGYTFSGSTLESNTADFSSAGQGVTARLNSGSVAFGTGQPADTISGIATVFGSTNGGNTFLAGPNNSETFGDKGNAGGDKIDFSSLPGPTSSNPLTINAAAATSANGTSGFAATLGSVTDSFAIGSQNFTAFTGSQGGSTNFIAPGSTSGLSFTGQGPGNTADFSANPTAVTADLCAPCPSGAASLHGQVTFAGVGGADTLQGSIAKVVGSPVGKNIFDGALGGTTFVAQNATAGNTVSYAGLPSEAVTFNLPGKLIFGTSGIPDSYSFPAGGPLTVEGSANADTFQIGTTPVTIEGGGGSDIIDLSQVPASGTSPLTTDLNGNPNAITPAITGPTISGGVNFGTSTCSTAKPSAVDLCVGQVIGSPGNDTFIASANSLTATPPPLPAATINGNGGTDILNLSRITAPVTIDMPITTGKPSTTTKSPTCNTPLGAIGAVCPLTTIPKTSTPTALTFSGVATVIGTATGGDYFFAGSGTEDLSEVGAFGTLDYSAVVPPPNPGVPPQTGITVNAADTGGSFTGTVNSPPTIGVIDTFAGFATFFGTPHNDKFFQTGPAPTGGYSFNGGAGNNTLDLSAAPSSTIQFTTPSSTDGCTGSPNNDGTSTVGGTIAASFTCMASVTALASEYQISPGQSAAVNGGGGGTLVLVNDLSGGGVTVALPTVANGSGTVTGDGYSFSFAGMSTVDGTPFNDVFLPGSGNVTLNGEGGTDWLNYTNAPSAAYVNLSTSQYTIPSGTNAGTIVPAGTALGGFGGLTCGLPASTGCITLNNIPNVVDTAHFNDVVVGGPGSGRLVGGSNGNDTFVPTGGDLIINGGAGANNTIDLSTLPGPTTLNLWSSSRQVLGAQAGSVTLVPGTIETAIASPGGSTLEAGNGNNVTLMGGPGNDTLVAGVGNQTINGRGGNDTLVAGIGNDTLIGGNQQVTFIPGQGGTDTLQSSATNNILSYGNVPVSTPWKRPPLIGPVGALVNLSNQPFSVPSGEPFAGASVSSQSATGAWGATVLLSGANIGTVTGSPAPDVLVSGSNDQIAGGGGNDLFVIDGDGNQLTAVPGTASTFLFMTGDSNRISGGGSSTIDFSQVQQPACVTSPCLDVNLRTAHNAPNGTAQIGVASETLLPVPGTEDAAQPTPGILNIIGTKFKDILVAGAANATVTGLNGDDVLVASLAGHDTLLSGGGGNDTFCASAPRSCDGFTSGSGNTIVGGSGNNTICSQNGGADSINGGVGGFNFAVVDSVDAVINVQTIVRTPNSNC
jgi:Ca2+-binding RTX toxin-like protein